MHHPGDEPHDGTRVDACDERRRIEGPRPEGPRPVGRGAEHDPANRFDGRAVERDADEVEDADLRPETRVHADASRTILSRNTSPDVGFSVSLNPYRGCEHGCVYCYARPTHEFLGLSAGLDFERELFVKRDAAVRLRAALAAPGWTPETIALSGATDPYQPLERRERVTRACLEVLAEHRHPVAIISKNRLVLRDLDLLRTLAEHDAVSVTLSVTSLDDELRSSMEPRTSSPSARLDAIGKLAQAGIPVGVNVAPIVPGLTDTEMPRILEAAAEAGASFASMVMLRLPYAVEAIFERWLGTLEPARARRVEARIRDMRGGRMNDPRFRSRMRGEGVYAEQLRDLFRLTSRRVGLERSPKLSTAAFRVPGRSEQPTLF